MQLRIEEYMRVMQQRHSFAINRGASQTTIESFTFPHKYKKLQRGDSCCDANDCIEKCTICLSEFEDNEDVR